VNPWADTFTTASITFRLMESLAPEWAWGSLIGIGGLLQLISLFWGNGNWRRRTAFVLCLSWTFVAAMSWIAAWQSTAAPIYSLLAAWQFWVALRMKLYASRAHSIT
jgi:hypothetical protein